MRWRRLLMVPLLLAAVPCFAQRSTGTIRGVVTDPTAAVIAGAKVTVTHEDTGFTRSMTSNADGIYVLTGAARRPLPDRRRVRRLQVGGPNAGPPERRRRPRRELPDRDGRDHGVRQRRGQPARGEDGGRRGFRPRHRPAGPRAPPERPQLPSARDPHAGSERPRRPEHEGQGAHERLRPVGERRRQHRKPVDGGRREQQRRRVQPHDPRLPVGGRDRRVQDPPQQLRRGVRPGRRRPDQHRDPGRHERVPRQRLLLRPPRRAERHELLPGAGQPAQGQADEERLRVDLRRPHPQGQAALLRLPGVEP